MNRFERLFFILEKNDIAAYAGGSDPRGVVKLIVTADKIRIMAEISNLPLISECRYELILFFRNETGVFQAPYSVWVKQTDSGNVSLDTSIPYNGFEICGTALASRRANHMDLRQFPLVSFKVKPEIWREILSIHTKVSLKESAEESNAPDTSKLEKPEKQITQAVKEPEVQEIPPESNAVAEERQNLPQKSTVEEPEPVTDRAAMFHSQFAMFDPFDTTNANYRWWKGSDMHLINRNLIKIGIKLPFELNKEGYLACELFGHILLGLYHDKSLNREFFILGIPAADKDGAGNFYSNSRWEELPEQEEKKEESGYWLTYIDCESSKVVKVI